MSRNAAKGWERRSPTRQRAGLKPRCRWVGVLFLSLLLLTVVTGCRTAPLPPVDLAQPAWTTRQGQAVWTAPDAKRSGEGIAGELLIATQPDGSCWVQFSKPPFNLVTTQRAPPQWQVESQQGRRRQQGRGAPPPQWIWFQLVRALQNEPLAAPWQFVREPDGSWRLVNSATGERLEGYLVP